MLGKCFINDAVKKTALFEWPERLRKGRECIADDERSGRPSTSKSEENVDKVKEMLAKNLKLTIGEIADDLSIPFESVQSIVVNDLSLSRVVVKLVPKYLNFMQKEDRVHIAKDDFHGRF